MPQDVTLAVSGLTGLSKACKLVGKEASKELRATLRVAAEPVRSDAEITAASTIRRIGPDWSKMRTGVTQRVVYVAPKQRGRASKENRNLRRPNLADLLLDRAMIPALNRNIPHVERAVDRMLTDLGQDWERVPNG